MNGKRKYELIISTIFLIGAILCGIFDIFSLVIYLYSSEEKSCRTDGKVY